MSACCRYSFDTGVSVLPIPELMPFRLTQQMMGVLEPLDAKVLLRNPMAQVMTALRGGRDILQASCETCCWCASVRLLAGCYWHMVAPA